MQTMLALEATLLAAVGTVSIAFAEPGAAMRERAFWSCDYVATTRGVHFTPIEDCARVTDELKEHKFGGDYDRMVRWWRDRKLAEHAKLRLEEARHARDSDPRGLVELFEPAH